MRTVNEIYPELGEELKKHDQKSIKEHLMKRYKVNSFKKLRASDLEEFLKYLKSEKQ